MNNKYSHIETERLILREWQWGDISQAVEGLNNFNVAKNILISFPYTEKDAKDFIGKRIVEPNNKKNLYFAVTLKETGEVIGGIAIRVSEENVVSGGIWLNERYHRQGYGPEAWRARTKFCFDILKVKHIEDGYLTGNEPSWKMQSRMGYKANGEGEKNCPARGGATKEFKTILTRENFIE